jgi:hypothetical protein
MADGSVPSAHDVSGQRLDIDPRESRLLGAHQP